MANGCSRRTRNSRFGTNDNFRFIVRCNFGTAGETEFVLRLFITETANEHN